MSTPDPVARERWHVGKEVPLTLLVSMAVQTVILTFYLSGQLSDIKSNVAFMKERVDELRVERYTRTDASRDAEVNRARDQLLTERVEDHERRIRDLEAQLRAAGRGR